MLPVLRSLARTTARAYPRPLRSRPQVRSIAHSGQQLSSDTSMSLVTPGLLTFQHLIQIGPTRVASYQKVMLAIELF